MNTVCSSLAFSPSYQPLAIPFLLCSFAKQSTVPSYLRPFSPPPSPPDRKIDCTICSGYVASVAAALASVLAAKSSSWAIPRFLRFATDASTPLSLLKSKNCKNMFETNPNEGATPLHNAPTPSLLTISRPSSSIPGGALRCRPCLVAAVVS